MPKQQSAQHYIYKLPSSFLRRNKWNATLPLKDVFTSEKVQQTLTPLADSQCFRIINKFNGTDTNDKAQSIKRAIKGYTAQNEKEPSEELRKKIQRLRRKLYYTRFEKDYVCVVVESLKDYDRLAQKGFTLNGIKYREFLGTTGGVKQSTIIFINEEIHDRLTEYVEAGRNPNKELVPSKFQAYKALVCSGSIPVSMPKGIIVVKDCITHFKSDVISINDENGGEPEIKEVRDQEITLDITDGCGMMLPSLAQRWNKELYGVEGMLSGINTRGLPWTKGMLFTFDFLDFAENVAHSYEITDVWGDKRDIREAEVILTESMVKLWDSYSSFEDYWINVEKYGYEFAVAKTAPHELEQVRQTNYQFLQSYHLSDQDIEELVNPTLNAIKDVMGLDYRKALIYLLGKNLTENSKIDISAQENYITALMLCPNVINDSYIRSTLCRLITKRIQRAKIGVLDVHGNFAIIGGDLYALCQSMFGLEITGLLKANEVYHKFWQKENVTEIMAFRAPMSVHNNIRKLSVADREDTNYWFRYIETCCILNAWDTTCMAENGCDTDGDLFFTTNNRVLLDNWRDLPAIDCVQRKAPKQVITQEAITRANRNAFGDDIGTITNRITAQTSLCYNFPEDSKERKTLEYRMMCGQLYQQNAIDKIKGISASPMPKEWYNNHVNKVNDDDSDFEVERKIFNQSICVDKKPYFFIYNYSRLKSELLKVKKTYNFRSIVQFDLTLEELLKKEEHTQEEADFLYWYYRELPVFEAPCVMNKICWYIENNIKNPSSTLEKDNGFDYSIYKSGDKYDEKEYSKHLKKLTKMYRDYSKKLEKIIIESNLVSQNKDNSFVKAQKVQMLNEWFLLCCRKIVTSDNELVDCLVDICYQNQINKRYAWNLCGKEIIHNIIKNVNSKIHYPYKDDNGDIEFCGEKYKMAEKEIKSEEEINAETYI